MRHGFHATPLVDAVAMSLDGSAPAAEGSIGAGLPGSRGPMAGFTPPTGISFQADGDICDEKAGGGRPLPRGGLGVANVPVSKRIIAKAKPVKTINAIF
jgi:hypothetical protein